jgi:uncharacterized protein YjbI with pentapeptide repeats
MKKLFMSTLALSIALSCTMAMAATGDEPTGMSEDGYTNITGGNNPTRSTSWVDHKGAEITNEAPAQSVDVSAASFHTSAHDFAHQNLTHSRFTRKYLHGANFHQAILTDSNFYGADAINADFSGAMMMGADMRWGRFYGADLSNADLTNARLWGAKLQDAKYNSNTKFPHKFVPQRHGMIMKPQ